MNTEKTFEPVWAIGLMTGTVLDGNIDVALLKTDGESAVEFGDYVLAPYDPSVTELLHVILEVAQDWNFQGPEPSAFAEAEEVITRAQAEAVLGLLHEIGLNPNDVGIVGLHGQTVLHRAPTEQEIGRTRQLGDGELMSTLLGIPVAYDFRSEDMRHGGQGAPLAAIYHTALLRKIESVGDVAVLNLGGVANLTWWDGNENMVAFDTGPANAPVNDFVSNLDLGEMDHEGKLASLGVVDNSRLQELLQHPYLVKPYPKSLDRNDFRAEMAHGLGAEDGSALLTAFCAAAVGKGLDLLPKRPQRLIVTGGGRHNPAMMKALAEHAMLEVLPAEKFGWRGDAVEAECFAYLATRVLRGLPYSFPSTTGANRPVCGGRLARP